MKRFWLSVGLAVAALGLAAPGARAINPPFLTDSFCTTFDLCMRFDLTDLGSLVYRLDVTYVGAPDGFTVPEQGAVTAAGIMDLLPEPNFTLTFQSFISSTNGQIWDACGSNDLSPGEILLCAASPNGKPEVMGLQVGESVAFSFLSDATVEASDFAGSGELGFRAHVQSFGSLGCSLKPDSRADGHLVGEVTDVNWESKCGGGTVPEPVSTVLLGTGLLLSGAVLRRRHGSDTGPTA